jgi:RNA-directed DNA polymerase
MLDTFMDGEVQRVQAMLYAKAKAEPLTRFTNLYKYLPRHLWIDAALTRVLRNKGSRTAGIDGVTRGDLLDGDERLRLITTLHRELQTQTYRPQPARRVYIPKPNGKKRPLGILTLKDRVVQQLVRMLLEPIFEAKFLPCSYGFRPNRCTWDAIAEARQYLKAPSSYSLVIEGDIQDCFGTINHARLMEELHQTITDKRLLALLWELLRAGVMEQMQYIASLAGTPQGGLASPLLANVYLHKLDEWMHYRFHTLPKEEKRKRERSGALGFVRYIRFADDFIILLRGTAEQAALLKQEVSEFVRQELKMTLSEEKTLITSVREGFDFLGVRTLVAPRRSDPTHLLPYHIPAQKSVQAYRQRVRELTQPRLDYLAPAERILTLNWLIEGWANYHHWGNAKRTFSALSSWTIKKVHQMLRRYTPGGKTTTYEKYFHPVASCTNLGKWKRYTNWRTPAIQVDPDERLGCCPWRSSLPGTTGTIGGAKYHQHLDCSIPS